ncbi:retrovirus-related pol polyprotein from transposon TNT 1-94 [Tanacetum coccineum]|uniref:Retrovirus-related pol polyprotein from transposon TNT 1-94 n=1 Tax=Tanacetum coccineum TaxID=301880 RepID=A0ABQ4Y7K9_9ASTR
MDSIIPLGQKNTLAEYMILFGADNRPPMLDNDLYDLWKGDQNKEIYSELSAAEKIQADCDMKATNIIPQGFVVLVFFPGDDPIACLNKAMAFLTAVASSRFPSTNNQLRTSSNPRNQATIPDGRVTVQQVQGIQGQSYSGTGYKSNATSSGGNNTSGQAMVVKCYNYQDKAMLAEAQEAGQILDEEQLAFLADPGVLKGQAVQTIIPNNAAFQTEDLNTYDSDCDDISNAKAVLMANISNYGSDVISEVPHSETYLNDMENQKLSAEQAFWLRMSNPTSKPSDASPVKIKAPKELPKTKNVELENSVAKLLSEKEHLCKEINHVKQVFKEQFDSIKTTRVYTKEHSDSLIDKLNLKSAENEDLKAQIQDKGIVEQAKAKQPLDKELDFACRHAQQIQELLVYVRDTCPNAIKLNEKKVVVTLKNKVKKVRFAEPLTSSSNIKPVESSTTSDSNTPVLSPTGLKLGLKWKPTRRTFTIVGNSCPLTRITSANVVPPKKLTSHSVETQKPKLKVYRRKPKNDKNVGSSKKANIVESKNADHSEPNHTWGSNATNIPSSSSLFMTGCPDCSLVSGLRVDLLSGSRDTNLYTISLDDMLKTSLICLLSKALKTKSWLWHRQLSHLNFDTLNKLAKDGLARGIPRLKFQKDHLCSACALGKSKKSSHQPKAEDTNQEKLYLLHMDLCGPMRVASINEKRYILVIVDDYSRFTWAEAINTACYTQHRSLIRLRYNKTPYELMQDKKPDLSFFYVFGALCYPTNDNDDLGKLDAKAGIEAAAPRAVVLADSLVSTSIDQDDPSISISSTQEQEHSPNISQGFKESLKTPIFCDDPLHESFHEDSTSQGSSSNVRQNHTPFEHLGRWTKDHPIVNIIGDPSRSVSTRKQLETDAMWCYFDAFLTSVEPKNFKQSMTKPSWIDAMQEEIHEIQRLEVWEMVSCPDKVLLIKLKWIYKVKTDEFGGDNPSHVYKQKKALYGLKQAPCAWYDMLSSFLISQHFSNGAVDPTLFARQARNDLLLMSFFLGLQISQSPRGIFINQSKYAFEIVKKYGMLTSDSEDTPMVEKSKLDEDL